jgi:hypothetical protein
MASRSAERACANFRVVYLHRFGNVYMSYPSSRRGIRVGEPSPQTRFEAGDVVVVLGEPDSLAAAEIRLLTG